MSKNKFLPLLLITSFLFMAAGCTAAQRTPPAGAFPPGGQPTATVAATATSQPATEAATATSETSEDSPAATQDFISLLVTQAYSQVTLTPHVTQAVPAESATAVNVPASIAQYLTPTPAYEAPASVIFSEPIQIANAVNAADCKIRSVGDCTTVMESGNTLFFTFTFGVEGAQSFKWGNAAIVVTRNGETYTWTQTGNVSVKAPDFTKNESWTLNVGQSAKFAGSLDNAQPGAYTAELIMCTLSPEQCSTGQGWQSVGGQEIHFVIES